MKKVFKKVAVIAIVAVTMSVSAAAQQGEKAVGGNLILGTGGSYSHVGIGGKFLFNVTDPIRLAGEFDLFPKKDFMSWWDFSVYGHYLIPVSDKVAVYPSVGLGMVGAKVDFGIRGLSYSDSWFAFSLGGGIDFALTDNLALTGELRYKMFGGDLAGGYRANLAVGLIYKF